MRYHVRSCLQPLNQSHRRDISHVVLLRVPRRYLPLYTQRLYIWSSVVCTHSRRKIYFPTNSPPRLLPDYFNFGGHEYRGQGTLNRGIRLRAVYRPRGEIPTRFTESDQALLTSGLPGQDCAQGFRDFHQALLTSGLPGQDCRPWFSEFPPRPFSHLAYPVPSHLAYPVRMVGSATPRSHRLSPTLELHLLAYPAPSHLAYPVRIRDPVPLTPSA
jgi:hypothetical protein